MKRSFFILTLFTVLLLSAAETVQVPITLVNDGIAENVRLFNIGIPLRRGELNDVKNLKLTDADGREIPSQCEVISRHPDNSLAWVHISGLTALGKLRTRKIFAEYGDKVLRSTPRGIVCAESGGRMLIDAGAIAAEFDLEHFSLPQKLRCNGIDVGHFASFDQKLKGRFTVEKSGNLHFILRADSSETSEYGSFRMHFFYGVPAVEIEFTPTGGGSASLVNFVGSRKYSFDMQRRGETFRYRFEFGNDNGRAVVAPPLAAVLPRWHLERTGIVPPEGLLAGELRTMERDLLKRISAAPAEVPAEMLLEAYLRSGNLEFFSQAVRRKQEIVLPRAEIIMRAHGVRCATVKRDISQDKVVAAAGLDTASLIGQLLRSTPGSEAYKLGIDNLISRFDMVRGSWFARLPSAGYVSARKQLQALKLVLTAAVSNSVSCYDEVVARGLERFVLDGIGRDGEPEIFDVLALAAEFCRLHPNWAAEISAETFLIRQSKSNKAPLNIRIVPGGVVKAAALHNEAVWKVFGFTARKDIEVRNFADAPLPGYFSGRDNIYNVRITESGGKMINNSKIAAWLGFFPASEYELTFDIRAPGVEVMRPVLRSFTADVRRSGKLRVIAKNAGEVFTAVAVSPDGKKTTVRGSANSELLFDRPGRWQIFIHSPNGNVSMISDAADLVI